MEDLANERVLDRRHPVLRQEYAVYTPPMDEMINTIGDWIDQRLSGGYIYGPSRFGKSRAVKWHVRAVLEERFRKTIPLVVWVRRPSAITEGEFWNTLLEASKWHFFDPLKPKKKVQARFLFKQRLISLARAAYDNYVTLMIDEAHDVTLNEWKWLLGLQNDLDFEGIRFSVFSIGSHQIGYQPNYLARTGNAHIAARFFAADARFYGIRNADELEYALNGYDVDSDWPPGSGTSYLKYFAPDEFGRNNRLVSCTDEIWSAFMELLPPELQSEDKRLLVEIPMQHVALAIEQALRLLAAGKDWQTVTAYSNWLKVIAKTGFTDHLRKVLAPA